MYQDLKYITLYTLGENKNSNFTDKLPIIVYVHIKISILNGIKDKICK
jgi:serine protease inhibitor ecotin